MENKDLIPFFGLKRQYKNLREELLDASDHVYSSGQVLDGLHTRLFEQLIAKRCNRQFAIAVNSCTQGLIMAMQTISQTTVAIPAVSFAATVNSVLMTTHTPKFVDVDYQGLMDLDKLDTTDVGVIMYANLFGNTVDYDRFRIITEFFGNGKYVIEDAAQSFGASYKGIPSGKMGDISVLSFDPTKNLPNYGSGGMILTDDIELAMDLLNLRDNGKNSDNAVPGTNSKMSESDCAQMLVKLKHFDAWQERRNAIAKYYTNQLCNYVDVLGPDEDVEHAWHKFILRVPHRSKLADSLISHGIETKHHYSFPLTDLEVSQPYVEHDYYYGAENFCRESLSLPIYPELLDSEVEYIVETIRDFYR